MRALSLTQPRAWAIFNGKDVENRTWQSKFRGRVYIHASKRFDYSHFCWIASREKLLNVYLPRLWEFKYDPIPRGAIIGEVDIIGCEFYPPDELPGLHSPWAMPGQYQFILANAVEYDTPITCKGMLGFFEPNITTSKE